MSSRPVTRAQQRRDTEARILQAARNLFAEAGYEATTIRAIAAEAATDPGLVMRYFGSKADLFARVAGIEPDAEVTGTPEQAAEQLLAALEHKLAEQPIDALAAIRSMFTHPGAADDIRTAMTTRQRQAADHMATTDADLRAGLIGAITIGAVIGRHLLQLDGLRDAEPERITAMLRHAFHDIVHGTPESPPDHAAPGASHE
ncbi:TetR/AcrR family transcriptional regulator [Nocardia violaceofusca]|uniref:TetR/AcrR family transcriptional regulator n=1 Tax=Nocardia violaceofusca TaxID=941182 RepID=UPI0007A473C6|nr:TetR/AcrR family transcriptional regulator [Nocardia violaceofusca]